MKAKWMRSSLAAVLMIAMLVAFVPAMRASAAEEIPEEVQNGTVVWSFDNVPEDLDGWYSDLYVECGWNQPGTLGMGSGNWTLSVEPGKGVNGSKALSCFLPEHVWGNSTYLEMSYDNTAVVDWGDAEYLYMYADASGIDDEQGVRLDIILKDVDTYLAGYPHPAGATYFAWQSGAWSEMKVNEWGHIIVPAGFVGWLKLPIANVLDISDVSNVTRIGFYTEHQTKNGTLYLDHFTVDAKVDVPGEPMDPPDISEGTVVWDMENIPDDLSSWTTDKFFELWEDEAVGVMGGNWKPVSIATKGFNGSTALGWRLLTTNWGSTTYINLDNDSTAITNWTGATELCFYVDATQIGADMPIDILLPLEDPDVTMIAGATYYIWKNNKWAERTVNEWNHIVVPANFAGWIKIPLAGVYGSTLKLEDVFRIGFYTEHSKVNGTVYFDHFVINTKASQNAPTPGDPSDPVTDPSTPATDATQPGTSGGDAAKQPASLDWLWIVLAVVLCAGIIVAAVIVRKKRNNG